MTDDRGDEAELLFDVAAEALDLGFDCFTDGDHAPFVILVEGSGRRHLVNLESESGSITPELVDTGRDVIRAFTEGRLYALVWDGFLTTDGRRRDAVFTEAGERGGEAMIFAQQYRQLKSGKLSRVGDPLIVGDAEHLWAERSSAGSRGPRRRLAGAARTGFCSPGWGGRS